MFLSRKLPQAAPPRPVFRHDYREQWDGHKLFVSAEGRMAFATGEGIRDGDVIETDHGIYRARDVCGCDYSDLFMLNLEKVQ